MNLFKRFFPLFVALILVAIWWLVALKIGVSYVLPTPYEAVTALAAYLSDEVFYLALGYTLLRALGGFLCSMVIALAFAVLSAVFPLARRGVRPVMAVVRAVPTMAIIFLLTVWFKPSLAPAVVALIVLCPTLYSAFDAAIQGIDPGLIELCNAYHVGKRDRVFKLYLPGMAEGFFEGCASGISLNLKLVVAAEAIVQSANSIGKLMQYTNIWLETEKLFALTVAVMLCSALLEWLIRQLGRRVMVWKR